jgi:hypothetical protein
MKAVEKIKTHILCSTTFFPQIVPFMRKSRKRWWSQRGRRGQYGGALQATISKATRAQAHASARAPTHTRKNTCTHGQTRTQKYVTHCFFLRQQRFRKRASVIRHTYALVITEKKRVYCAVRTWSLNKTGYISSLMGWGMVIGGCHYTM